MRREKQENLSPLTAQSFLDEWRYLLKKTGKGDSHLAFSGVYLFDNR
jgi:hypothetical protein